MRSIYNDHSILGMKQKCFFRLAHELIGLLWERDYRYKSNLPIIELDSRIDTLTEGNIQLQETCTLLLILNSIPDPELTETLENMILDPEGIEDTNTIEDDKETQ